MKKNTKQLITLAAAAVLVGGLAAVYIWQGGQRREAEASATPAPTITPNLTIISRTENEVARVTFENKGTDGSTQTFTLIPVYGAEGQGTRESWALDGSPDLPLNQTTAEDMIRGLYSLTVAEMLFERVDNPGEYGLSPAAATATAQYEDGSQAVVYLGKMTPAKDRYYVMVEGDPAVYLIYTYYGNRYFNGPGELMDRTIPAITAASMEYLLIQERGKTPIEFAFDGTEEEQQEMYEQYGMIYVTMMQPFPGREMYYSNFERAVLEEFNYLALGDMVALRPDDLSPYGLDNPSVTVWVRDAEQSLHMHFGNRTEDNQIYCKFDDRPVVFLTDYDYVKQLYNINVFTFIERFAALLNIDDCERIEITSPGRDTTYYDIYINHTVLLPEAGEEEGEKVIRPTVNSQPVQDKAFRTLYQRLIGLTYDTEIETFTPSGEPIFSITYHVSDKEPTTVRTYPYDANFYALQRDGNPIQFVTSKQSTDILFQTIADLLSGKLDRDY